MSSTTECVQWCCGLFWQSCDYLHFPPLDLGQCPGWLQRYQNLELHKDPPIRQSLWGCQSVSLCVCVCVPSRPSPFLYEKVSFTSTCAHASSGRSSFADRWKPQAQCCGSRYGTPPPVSLTLSSQSSPSTHPSSFPHLLSPAERTALVLLRQAPEPGCRRWKPPFIKRQI